MGERKYSELRTYRKHIPVLLRPAEMNPDSVIEGLEQVLLEFKGEFKPIRKPWRTQIRIEDVDTGGFAYIVVPAWNSNDVIRLKLADLPAIVQTTAKLGKRLHARVNIGADSDVDLYFDSWEAD